MRDLDNKLGFQIIAAVGACLVIGGCPSPAPADGGDGGADVSNMPEAGTPDTRTDTPMADTPMADTPMADTPMADTPMADAPDGGACSGTIDARNYWPVNNTVMLRLLDLSLTGGMAITPSAFFVTRAPTAAPTAMAGACYFYPTRFGSVERAMAPSFNYGAVSLTQGMSVTQWTYNTAMMGYTADTTRTLPTMSNMPMTLAVLGGPDGAATTTMLDLPPLITAAQVELPMALSRSADLAIRWTVPPGVRPGDAAIFATQVMSDGSNLILCGVPACAGTITVPRELTARIPADGASVGVTLMIARQTAVASAHPFNFVLAPGVANFVPIVP